MMNVSRMGCYTCSTDTGQMKLASMPSATVSVAPAASATAEEPKPGIL